MALTPGTRLGPFEIASPLGAGGMGEVYRARDTKLKREVALKILPELFANDAQRMARFEREAQVLASLNHSHIAHIHGLEDSNGINALVMELVEGQTLAERIALGPMPVEEAVPLAKQIAEALEYAHDRAIIHRDLKPANIKLTLDGQAKILDFGLAKALEGDGSEVNLSTSPTISVAATRAGVLLGTAAYMSPEQAKGKAVDRRADIWAFGCVIFEMLAGKAAFGGETITDTLAAVVRAEPEWTQLPEKTPIRIRELLQRCLVKDPKQRLQAIGEARITLEKYLANPSEEPQTIQKSRKNNEKILAATAIFVIVGAIFFGILYWNLAPKKPQVIRSYIRANPNSSFLLSGPPSGFALSPDGQHLAYVAQNADGKAMLWVRALNSVQAQPLDGTLDATFPFWSPDGRYIGFFADSKLKKIEASGGPPLALCDAAGPRGGTWNQEGVILFTPSTNSAIQKVSGSGGTPTPVTTLNPSRGETTHRWPQFLPDGRHFLYVAGTPFGLKENPTNAIVIGSLDSKESKVVLHTHASAIYASGYLLFLRSSTLMAQPFDTKRLEFTGDALPVADPVEEQEGTIQGYFSVSENGLLAYLEGTASVGRELIWVDRNGKRIGEVPGKDAYIDPRISPDGKKVAYTIGSSVDVWSYDIARGVKTRLTFRSTSAPANTYAVWSPDGQRFAYTSIRSGKYDIYQKPADGSGNEGLLLEGSTGQARFLNDWSPDGKYLTYSQGGQGVNTIQILPLNGEKKPYTFLPSQFSETQLNFSPDGKWVAYCSNESGSFKVYVAPFPGPGGKWQVSPGGGCTPRWRRDGKEIFYLSNDNKITAAEVKAAGTSFETGKITPLIETRVFRSVGGFDVTGDGQRFVIAYEPGETSAAITLVVNWNAELKK